MKERERSRRSRRARILRESARRSNYTVFLKLGLRSREQRSGVIAKTRSRDAAVINKKLYRATSELNEISFFVLPRGPCLSF